VAAQRARPARRARPAHGVRALHRAAARAGRGARRLAYEVATPETGLLRVTLAAGGARVERPAQPAARGALDTAVEGDLAALAPLAAGGAGWRLRDADVRCGRLRLHRLLRARRAPVTSRTRRPARRRSARRCS
jgi:hypothetical protein